jgi:cytidine deaminase
MERALEEFVGDLTAAAKAASLKAYCPYSAFPVGAALLSSTDEIFQGCNVENASYGLTICAERNALFGAITKGITLFRAVLVYTPTMTPTAPCGACRQVLNEFAPNADVFCVCDGPEFIRMKLSGLLPHPFGPHNL